ncbi:MAG: hypothetical protein RLZZ598_1010 [Pseudomonadota bacterium]
MAHGIGMWTQRQQDGVTIVAQDAAARSEVLERWQELDRLLATPARVIIDLHGETLITSEALAVLVAIVHRQRQSGGRLALCRVHPGIANVLASMRLSRLIDVHVDVASAVAALRVSAAAPA